MLKHWRRKKKTRNANIKMCTHSVVCLLARSLKHTCTLELIWICDSGRHCSEAFPVNLFKMRTCICSYRDSMKCSQCQQCESFIHCAELEREPKLCQTNGWTDAWATRNNRQKERIKFGETTRKRRLNNCQRQMSVSQNVANPAMVVFQF